MNAVKDGLAQRLRTQLEDAIAQQGVTRELLLLRTLNMVIAQVASSEADWSRAQSLEYRRWREAMGQLLDELTFMIATADAYAPENTGLAAQVTRLQAQLREMNERIAALQGQADALAADLEQARLPLADLAREVELLQTLQTLAPWREALMAQLSEQRLRALADRNLGQGFARHRQRIEQLYAEVDTCLNDIEVALRDDIELSEQEWQIVREAATRQPHTCEA